MVMLTVVPAEELCADGSGVFDGAEPGGELGPVLECFELRFGIGIVV